MRGRRYRVIWRSVAALAISVGAMVSAWGVRARRLFGRRGGDNGRGLSGSRVPRRPHPPFMPPRAAAAEPERNVPNG